MSNTQVICQAAVAITGVKCQWPIMSQRESRRARQKGKGKRAEGGERERPEASLVGSGAYLR